MSFSIRKGDLAPDLLISLKVNGIVEPLADYSSFTMKWTKPDGTVVTVALLVSDSVNGILRYPWVAGDTDIVGRHTAIVTGIHGDGDPQSFPTLGDSVTFFVS